MPPSRSKMPVNQEYEDYLKKGPTQYLTGKSPRKPKPRVYFDEPSTFREPVSHPPALPKYSSEPGRPLSLPWSDEELKTREKWKAIFCEVFGYEYEPASEETNRITEGSSTSATGKRVVLLSDTQRAQCCAAWHRKWGHEFICRFCPPSQTPQPFDPNEEKKKIAELVAKGIGADIAKFHLRYEQGTKDGEPMWKLRPGVKPE